MINILKNIGNVIDLEFNINKDIINEIDSSPDENTKEKSQEFINNYDQIKDNFNNVLVISQGLINNYLKELNLSTIQ